MAYIAPNTDVNLYANVPLTPEYANTISFDGVGIDGQRMYFETKVKHRLKNFSYQRKTGSIAVNLPIEDVITCNYMSYKNNSFENKTFYAFITNCEYVSNNVTEIFFEEDIMQTWLFDYTARECFIVRQHALTDEIGDNCVPEDFELGQYIVPYTYYLTAETTDLIPVIVCGVVYDFVNETVTPLSVTSTADFGYFQPINYIVCGAPFQAAKAIDAIEKAGYQSSILTVVMYPKKAFPNFPANYVSPPPGSLKNLEYTISRSTIDGYVPKNNKMFTAPYNWVEVTNGQGQSLKIEPQYLKNSKKISFEILYSIEPSPTVSFNLKDYKRTDIYSDNVLKITNYPVCAYLSDTYKTWYAQNSIAYQYDTSKIDRLYEYAEKKGIQADAISTIVGASTGLAGGVAGVMGSIALSGVKFITNGLDRRKSKTLDKYNLSTQYMKSQLLAKVDSINIQYTGSGSADFAYGSSCVKIKNIQITAEFAQKIDMFFSVYGYAVNAFGQPHETGRRNFNYVKTAGSDVIGNIPQYALSAINDIYDNGITFWHNPDGVGNYNVVNDIVGSG